MADTKLPDLNVPGDKDKLDKDEEVVTEETKTPFLRPADGSMTQRGGRKCIKVNNWILMEKLGSGSDSSVYLSTNAETKEKAAVKVVKIGRLAKKTKQSKQVVRGRIEKEIKILSELNHPGVVKLQEALWNGNDVYLVLEFVDGGDLVDYLSNTTLDEDSAREIFLQLCYATQYCHYQSVFHRDLKLENILFDAARKQIKVTDFGYAKVKAEGVNKFQTLCGTVTYLSPEVLQGKEYHGGPVDMWALGVILFALLCGRFPFTEAPDMPKYIIKGDYIIPDSLSKPARKLIKKLLCVNPKKRATFDDVFSSEFLADHVDPNSPLYPAPPGNAPAPSGRRKRSLGRGKKKEPLVKSVDQSQGNNVDGEKRKRKNKTFSFSRSHRRKSLQPIVQSKSMDESSSGARKQGRKRAKSDAKPSQNLIDPHQK
mmetsp:Transcript_23522/g.66003  ORF Transcript_23522/g.66003 Transcript_23522/m.66003 type:complete len:426 (+) Transcript_23522:91-1368(+)